MAGRGGSETLIGQSVRRPNAPRLAHGRGRYTDDIALPRMLHLGFVRSPYAHARILSIETGAAAEQPGVYRVITGAEVAAVCAPMSSVAEHRPGHKSATQNVMAVDVAYWQGEPVVAVVAETRAAAEDAAELVLVEWEELETVVDMEAALEPGSTVIHPDLGDNLAFQHTIESGDPAAAMASAAHIVEHDFEFGRHTAVTLESRVLIADYDPVDGALTVHQSHQSPYQMQDVYARHLAISEHKVRVVCPDVGGGFGLKINVHGEELAVAAVSRLLARPVKFCADRLESFAADCQTRDHRVTARMGVDAQGRIAGIDMDNILSIGPFTAYIRFGIAEGMMAITSAGAPYAFDHYRGRTRVAYVNKGIIGMYRGVGIPIGCAVTEQMIDFAAHAAGIDPVEFRRRNFLSDDAFPLTTVAGTYLNPLSLNQTMDAVVDMMGYDNLRAEQERQREKGVYRGIGVATFVEPTAYGPSYYGPSGARVSTQDGCTVKLEPSGKVRCMTSVTDQGQGTLTSIAQIVADGLGVGMDDVDLVSGDSAVTPYGGGAWASRGMAMGGEAALEAAAALRDNILALAASVLQADPARLALADGEIRDAETGTGRMDLAEVARIGYFRQDTLAADVQPELMVTRHHVPNRTPYYVSNGVQASHVEIDLETGFIRLLGHWVADDCGRVINPLLVDEQIRGGVVQGIGGALFEHCQYDAQGQLLNGTLADYLVPMASEMPDIHVAHVETPIEATKLGAKGVGEAGTIGAMAALWCAVNDGLRPLGARVTKQPFTPAHVLEAIRAAR